MGDLSMDIMVINCSISPVKTTNGKPKSTIFPSTEVSINA